MLLSLRQRKFKVEPKGKTGAEFWLRIAVNVVQVRNFHKIILIGFKSFKV